MTIPDNIKEDIRMIDVWLSRAATANAEVMTWLEENGIDTESEEFEEYIDPVWGFKVDKLIAFLKEK